MRRCLTDLESAASPQSTSRRATTRVVLAQRVKNCLLFRLTRLAGSNQHRRAAAVSLSYWDYPTQSNTAPTATDPPGGSNSGNFNKLEPLTEDTTEVGAYPGSTTFYGTFDQAGNVWEWTEAMVTGSSRGVRGGGLVDPSFVSAASHRIGILPTDEFNVVGFRVASVPEPSSPTSLWMLGLLCGRRRRARS